MSWVTEDGGHEGWASMELSDGRWDYGSSGSDGLRFYKGGDYGRPAEVVPYSEVIGWRGRCSCGWTGEFWTRVTDPAETNPMLRRIYVAANEMADAPPDVEEAIGVEWQRHVEPDERVADVRDAARQVAHAREHLDQAVATARSAGASWVDIGQATGMTRQSARERWG